MFFLLGKGFGDPLLVLPNRPPPYSRVLAASVVAVADVSGLRRAEETKLSRSWVPLDRWNGQAKLARA